jgi:hypothetical protein
MKRHPFAGPVPAPRVYINNVAHAGFEKGSGVTSVRKGRVMLLSAVALVVAGCSESPQPHTLVFDISGSGQLSTVSYVIDGKETTERSITVPWKKTIKLPPKDGGHTWRLKTQQGEGSGEFQVVVSVDGTTVTNGACAGDGGCSTNDSGSVRD